MTRKLTINDIDNAADLSAIATYAYLKAKHEQGYPLTPNEANLLNEPFHTTPLSMLLNSRHDYVYVVYEKGFDTALNLEYHVKNAVRANRTKQMQHKPGLNTTYHNPGR